jgi:hypothetical protein
MTYKDKIDYVLRFIAIIVSWPVVFLCAVFLVRKQLPLLITNLAERMTKAPGGFELIALKERVEEITERVNVLETTRFEPSNALTTALQTYLQSSFDVFQNYLIDIGYSPSEREVKILVDPEMRDNVYYDNENHRIVLGAPLANDSDAFFREYTHHALMTGMNPWELNNDQASLESALADYFPCSFNDDPLFGEKSIHRVQKIPGYDNKKATRDLNNDRKFSETITDRECHNVGEIWGGALWEIRQRLGKAYADKIIFSAWRAMLPLENSETFNRDFIKKLSHAAAFLKDGDRSAEIMEVFRRREFETT